MAFSEISNFKTNFLKKQRRDHEKDQQQQIIKDNYEVGVIHKWHWRAGKKKLELAVVLKLGNNQVFNEKIHLKW